MPRRSCQRQVASIFVGKWVSAQPWRRYAREGRAERAVADLRIDSDHTPFEFGFDLDVRDAAGHKSAKDRNGEAGARDFRPVWNPERTGFRRGFLPGNAQVIPLAFQEDIVEFGVGCAPLGRQGWFVVKWLHEVVPL
jgi:hypothetical protein